MIECRAMTRDTREDAAQLLQAFLREDEHYLDSSSAYGDGGDAALEQALDLFLSRPEIGFVWLAYEDGEPAAVCVVCLAISTSAGAVAAKLDDVYVRGDRQGRGIGTTHLHDLKAELVRRGVKRIDTSVHLDNPAARRFYERHGFRPLREERLACLL